MQTIRLIFPTQILKQLFEIMSKATLTFTNHFVKAELRLHRSMVRYILDGSSGLFAHVWSETGNLTCLRHLSRTRSVDLFQK